jgi:outer membrane protein TolC
MKYTRLLLLPFIVFVTTNSSFAQEDIIHQINTPLLDKYIELAKQYYPKRKIHEATAESAKAKIGIASASYLESLNVSYFYRPDNATVVNNSNPYSINGFQFGVYLNLGMFLRAPSLVKQAKAEHKAAVLHITEFDVMMAADVKQRYYDYLAALGEVKIRTQVYSDNKTSSDGLRFKFEKGEISLDDYTKAKTLTTYASSEKLQAELNYLRTKNALEMLIGAKLEEVK